jgi:MFS family permease
LVEQRIENPRVVGSIPTPATISSDPRLTAPAEWREGWPLVLASLVGITFSFMAMAAGYTLGVLTKPLEEAFGWSRQQILAATFVQLLGILPASFVVGWIADRYGVARVILISQLGLGLSFVALGLLTRDLASYYALYFMLALLSAGTLPITFMKAIATRFRASRGLAIGVALSGSGLCGLIVPGYTARAVESFGWRGAYVAAGLLPILVALPVAAWAFRRLRAVPAGPGQPVAVTRAPDAVAEGGVDLAHAARDYRFWCMGLAFFLVSAGSTAVLTSFVPLLVDAGMPAQRAAEILGALGLSVIAGRLAVGALADRMWAPLVGAIFVVPATLAAVALATTEPTVGLALLAAIAIGLVTGAEFDLTAYLIARYFGLAHFAKIYAGIYVLYAVGGGIAGPLFGLAYDRTGGYSLGLAAVAAAYVGCGLLLLTLGPYRDGAGEVYRRPGEARPGEP